MTNNAKVGSKRRMARIPLIQEGLGGQALQPALMVA